MSAPVFPHRHLLGIEGLSPSDITALLDLSDDLNEPRDTISLRDQSAWYVFRYPMRDAKSDRGGSGADLVDFLDGWICADFGDLGASDDEGLRGNALGLHDLAYDFAPVCP